jgi:hypothetical protein
MAKPKHEPMVKVVWYLPLWLKAELEAIKVRDGISLSQQARMSLAMWATRCKRDPHGALGALNPRGLSVPTEPESAYTGTPAELVPLGPEPDPETQPAEWAAWSARAGNQAIANLAKGSWPD